MAPDAKRQSNLLYVADNGYYAKGKIGYVSVWSYPQMKLKGELLGNVQANGLSVCGDKTGDVYITNGGYASGRVYEYAHGGTTPIATLNAAHTPLGCFLDPSTGNIAVWETEAGGGAAYLYVYPHGDLKAKPMTITMGRGVIEGGGAADAGGLYGEMCGYDTQGDMLALGNTLMPGMNGGHEAISLLAKGSKTFKTLALKAAGGAVDWGDHGGSCAWDGEHWTILQHLVGSGSSGSPVATGALIYTVQISAAHAAIARLMSSGGFYVGLYTLLPANGSPNVLLTPANFNQIAWWNYPSGGAPFRVATTGNSCPGTYPCSEPNALVVSRGTR